jgi:hypothetical protein
MRNMKRLALPALILLIPALLWANEKETMFQALGQFEQVWRSTTPCSSNACQTREIWLAQQAAQAADRYLDTPDAKEHHSRHWRLVALSFIKYSQARTEAYAGYVHSRHRDLEALEHEFRADLKAALRSDVNSREITQRFGLDY